MKFAFYLSDMGYGHAMREIAVMRELLNAPQTRIFVRAHTTANLIRASFPEEQRVEVSDVRNDVGALSVPGGMSIDREKTLREVRKWFLGWDDYIKSEVEFCEKMGVDLVVSDIVPQACTVAEEAGIPCAAIYNFTWDWIYESLFGKNEIIKRIADAYSRASIGIAMPFCHKNNSFKKHTEVGLIVRRLTRNPLEIRRRCGIVATEIMALVSFGFSTDIKSLKLPDSFHILISSQNALPGALYIPYNDTESQDWVAACDIALSKGSYSIVAEAIQGNVPLMLVRRDGFAESDIFVDEVSKLGIGIEISEDEAKTGLWSERLKDVLDCKENYQNLPEIYRRDGAKETAAIIQDLA